MEKNVFLKNVYGYKKIKDELFLIRSWYLDKKIKEEKKEFLPKGILFYGEPGNGKTLLLREYSKSFGFKVFVFEGKEENLNKNLISIYENAKKEKNAIVVIDELDRLVKRDDKLERILQTQLDGLNNEGTVLTLASANDYDALPDALLREGRFDRKFCIDVEDKKDNKEILEKLLKEREFNINEYELEELNLQLFGEPISKIKSLLNSVCFRYGKSASIDDFLKEYSFNESGHIQDDNLNVPDYVAVHEAGHALYAKLFAKRLIFLRVNCNKEGGKTHCSSYDNIQDSVYCYNRIETSLAGMAAEEIIFGKHNVGCNNDMKKAYEMSYTIMNNSMLNGLDFYSPALYTINNGPSKYEMMKHGIRTSKFIEKEFKLVKKRLKKYKKEILLIAKIIKEKRCLTRDDIKNVLD